MSAHISLLIRTKNEARWLPPVLKAITRQQESDFELIAVDSGSTDGSRELLEDAGARILHLAPDEFTYGRALNIGCRQARGENLVFLSAHAIPQSDQWLSELVTSLRSNAALAGVSGAENGRIPGAPGPPGAIELDLAAYEANPYLGLVNSNAAVRREVWERFPFNEDLTGAEDKEWTWRVLKAGYRVLLLPDANVEHRHEENLALSYRRGFREHLAFRAFGAPLSDYGFLRFLMEVTAAPLRSLGGEIREWPRYIARCWGKYRALQGADAPVDLYGR